jgi:hypothetical protein
MAVDQNRSYDSGPGMAAAPSPRWRVVLAGLAALFVIGGLIAWTLFRTFCLGLAPYRLASVLLHLINSALLYIAA